MATFTEQGPLAIALFEELIRHPSIQLLVPMNEASGSIIDRCVRNRLTGTVTGSPTYGVDMGKGFKGVTLVRANSERFDFGNVSLLNFTGAAPFSILAVIKRTTGGSAGKQVILGKQDAGVGWRFYQETDGSLNIQLLDGGGSATWGGATLTDGTLYQVVATYDGLAQVTSAKSYSNGVESTANPGSIPFTNVANAGAVQIGANASSEHYNGTLGLLAVFDAVLTPREIKQYAHMGGFV